MRIYKIAFISLVIAYLLSAFPLGYRVGSKLFNNPLHNQLYCSAFELMDKHESTKPPVEDWTTYLEKCTVIDKSKEDKIKEYIKNKKEELSRKRKVIEIQIERKIDQKIELQDEQRVDPEVK